MHLQHYSKFLLSLFTFLFSLRTVSSFSQAINFTIQIQDADEKEGAWQTVCFHFSSIPDLKV